MNKIIDDTTLNLCVNKISDAGALVIADALPKSKVSTLNLRGNEVSYTLAKAISSILSNNFKLV